MSPPEKDTERAHAALLAIFDYRDPLGDMASIMLTLEQTVAAALLAIYPDRRKAAAMLNEGLVPGIEERFAITARHQGGARDGD